MLANRLEQLTNEPLRCPARQTNLSFALADASHLCRRAALVGCEDHSKSGDHHVKATIVERQRLSISLAKHHREAISVRALAGSLQERWHVVGCDDVTPAPSSCKGDVPVASGNIEYGLASPQVECFAKVFANDLKGGTDYRVVTRRPRSLLAELERCEVKRCGRRSR
jgi:hypothetical protein